MAKNPRMVMCRKCNTAIAENVKRCPACGAKNKKPFYKKWWFILMIIIGVIGVLSLKGGKKGEEFLWSDIELGGQLPEPKSGIGKIISNSEDYLSMYVYKTSSDDYKAYIKACEDEGYVVESEKSESRYDAYNSEGYKLELWHDDNDGELNIRLEAPEEMKEISWTANGVGSLLPVPKSKVGKVTKDSSDAYIVEVGNTSTDDYAEYVEACENAGFTIDYSKSEESYAASNEDGYQLKLRYAGFNTMEVSIKAPEEASQTETAEESGDASSADNKEDGNTATGETTETEEDNKELVDGMRPEFKEAMDSYEAFYEAYCDVMKKYSNNPTDLSILKEYTKLMEQSVEMSEKFEAWNEDEMNAAELKYYLEVSGRVTQMMLEANL